MGNVVSLDKLLEKGIEIADKHLLPEERYIEKESNKSCVLCTKNQHWHGRSVYAWLWEIFETKRLNG
jgi:hypothetical protein